MHNLDMEAESLNKYSSQVLDWHPYTKPPEGEGFTPIIEVGTYV